MVQLTNGLQNDLQLAKFTANRNPLVKSKENPNETKQTPNPPNKTGLKLSRLFYLIAP